MANAQSSPSGIIATLIKSSKSIEWTKTIREDNSQKNCHFNLKENLVYINEEPVNSFSNTEIYPDLIVASGKIKMFY